MTPRQLAVKLEREYGPDVDISYLLVDNLQHPPVFRLTLLPRKPEAAECAG